MFAVLGAKFYQVFVFQSVMALRLHVTDWVQEMEVPQAQMFLLSTGNAISAVCK
jgi:hypothetical protein